MTKLDEAEYFITFKDICALVETKIDHITTDSAINPKGHFINRVDRNCFGGGVITYINPALHPCPLDVMQNKYSGKGLETTITRI